MVLMQAVLRTALCVVLIAGLPVLAAPPAPIESAHYLVRDVVFNELQDRDQNSFWQYRVDRTIGTSELLLEQVETSRGPIYRLLSRDRAPLTSVQDREENARLDELLQNPSDQARVQQRAEQDEQRLRRLMALMPDAFVYDYDGPQSSNLLHLRFAPNPDFKPSTYEARIFHALGGTLAINLRRKRMTHLQGRIMERIDFGWGLLGHVEKGGTFEIQRRPVNETHWKTELIDIQIDGRAVFFKSIAQHQREARSGFKPVPADITLPQARAILDRVAGESSKRRPPAS